MLSAPRVDLTFGDNDFDFLKTPPLPPLLHKPASVGSWGVTSIGRGFSWNEDSDDDKPSSQSDLALQPHTGKCELDPTGLKIHASGRKLNHTFINASPITRSLNIIAPSSSTRMPPMAPTHEQIFFSSPTQSPGSSPQLGIVRPPPSRSPSSPRPRRRSSRQRVSLIAGRVSIAPVEPPSPPPVLPRSLCRTNSSATCSHSAASTASTRPPSPDLDKESFLGERSISDFIIEGDIGRGAYGLVKRARRIFSDGSMGPPLVIKQVIKSRILADCWKKHPKHGTIPIEIYVMSAISGTPYALPPRRPWAPSRFSSTDESAEEWVEGQFVNGHPNICPLLDFFEDSHYYYLILPSTTPKQQPDQPPPPSDLFDLVETFPQGLPTRSIRTYLGQIADALGFLHSQGIVHRDVKDENVVLGPDGKCILIDFGSSGLIKKHGWDTFSGTLDYAGPEILRGERYYGKEQDVWAFGVVAYVLLVGECPFMKAEETQEGLESPFANASIALDERCVADGKEREGEEEDGGGALEDAAVLVRACLKVDVGSRPTFEKIMKSRFLKGNGGW